MKRSIVFRADGNAAIGYGHFIRTLGLAGILNSDFRCLYATQNPTSYQIEEIHKVCQELIVLAATENHFDTFVDHLKGDEIVVLDNYYFTSEYQLQIRNKGCKVVYIDDMNTKFFVCDALINNIPGFDVESFKKEKYTKLYLGTDYALLRKEFFNSQLRTLERNSKSIFLSFGGADSLFISGKIIEYLKILDDSYDLNLMVGDAFPHIDKLKAYSHVRIHKNITAAEVARLIASSGLCIVPASSLLNEVASIGCRVLIGYFADNQVQPYKHFVSKNLAIGLGDYRNLSFELFRERLDEVLQADYLISNQRKEYHYQQERNLRDVFLNFPDK